MSFLLIEADDKILTSPPMALEDPGDEAASWPGQQAPMKWPGPRATLFSTGALLPGIAVGVDGIDVPASSTSESDPTDELLAYAQIVVTLTARPALSGVRCVLDGMPLDVLHADGSLARIPLTRRDDTAVL